MTGKQTLFSTINREFKQAKLVISPHDRMTPNLRPFGQVGVAINPVNQSLSFTGSPIPTPSGSHALYDMSDGKFMVTISTPYYMEKEFEIELPFTLGTLRIDDEVTIVDVDGTAVANVSLLPSPAYILTPGATVIRVLFRNTNDKRPISDGLLYVLKNENNNEVAIFVGRTDKNGQALLCCNRMTRDSILQINGFDYNGPRQLHIRARDVESGQEAEGNITIKEFWSNKLLIELN